MNNINKQHNAFNDIIESESNTPKRSLIQKWAPVLESNIGLTIHTQAEAQYIALELEIQNKAKTKCIGYEDISAYFLPLVRRFYPNVIDEFYKSKFMLEKHLLSDKYAGLDLDAIISAGVDIGQVDLKAIYTKFNQFLSLVPDIDGLALEEMAEKAEAIIKEHITKEEKLAFYWYEIDDGQLLIKWF